MRIDLTLKITKEMLCDSVGNPGKALFGHVGTHFDVMDKEFPLSYVERKGICFDVRHICGRDIEIADIDLDAVEKDMFVAFCTDYYLQVGYGEKGYFTHHPQLSMALIHALLEKGISIIGIDFAGIRQTPEHIPADQLCADRGVFVIENLRSLSEILACGGVFTAHTYPMRCEGITGLPCRVIAEIQQNP